MKGDRARSGSSSDIPSPSGRRTSISATSKSCVAGQRQRGLAIARDGRLDPKRLDDLGQVLGQRLVVVDDENGARHATAVPEVADASRAGRVRTKVAPRSLGSRSIDPPWASRMRRQSARPRPLPLALVVKSASKIR